MLIIDDEENFAEMVKHRLEATGKYEVRALSEAKDVVSCLHEFRPNAILLDLLMPGTGGLDVCEMLNSDPIGAGTPIIVVSGPEKDVDKIKAYKLGISDYIVKPIDSHELEASIEKDVRTKEAG